jgi:uncharacterized protein YacL (UPF0231 family)
MIFGLFDDKKKQEIKNLRQQVLEEKQKNLKDIKRIGQKFSLFITSGEIELVVRKIDNIRKE